MSTVRPVHPVISLITCCLASLVLVPAALGQTLTADNPGSHVAEIQIDGPGALCTKTLYDPDHIQFSDWFHGFIAQGFNGQAECSYLPPEQSIPDALYTVRYSYFQPNSPWEPDYTDCPTLVGLYRTGTQPDSIDCGRSQTNPGPLGSPDVVEVDGTYLMVFVGGNADIEKGHLFLARSSNGLDWTPYDVAPPTGFAWTPIVWPLYNGYPEDACGKFGVAQVAMVYEPSVRFKNPGWFYIYLHYVHPPDEGRPQKDWEILALRAPYDPDDAWKIKLDELQVCRTTSPTSPCSWVAHSGQLVWSYDDAAPVGTDPLLEMGKSARSMARGGHDIVWDPIRAEWLRVVKRHGDGQVSWQATSSLADNVWSTEQPLDYGPMNVDLSQSYPSYNAVETHYPGLWYSTYPGDTGLRLHQPIDHNGCSGNFRGLGVVEVDLDYVP